MKPDPNAWDNWLPRHPCPSLQDLITKYGTYNGVPLQAWAAYDAQIAAWETQRRSRLLGSHTWEIIAKNRQDERSTRKRRKKSTTAKGQNPPHNGDKTEQIVKDPVESGEKI